MLLSSSQLIDTPAADFLLPATDGKTYSLADLSGPNGTVVAFICNHCPYVLAIIERLVSDASTLSGQGIGFAAISANDPVAYPQDSFENMGKFAEAYGFGFPYLYDESQETARAYDAQCTPDIYGLNGKGIIKYHGRLDEGRTEAPAKDAPRELVEAMQIIAKTGEGPEVQHPSMGCSIKWR